MDEIIPNLYFLALAFCIVAFLYSSVGLGGGSSYTALMAIIGVHYLLIPTISLTLNLIVTSIASINFLRGGHGRIRLLLRPTQRHRVFGAGRSPGLALARNQRRARYIAGGCWSRGAGR